VTQPAQHVQCPKCGSTDFMEGEFRKWYQMPSAMPGGGLTVASENVLRALVCLCGEPLPHGLARRRLFDEQGSFQASIVKAKRYREEAEPQRIIYTLAGNFALKQDQENLAERVAKMEAVVEALPKASNAGKKPK
jgi:hypothetical protein